MISSLKVISFLFNVIFTLFLINSTDTDQYTTDAEWEGVLVYKKKASCSREKEDTQQN